jgi:hypothetical protein
MSTPEVKSAAVFELCIGNLAWLSKSLPAVERVVLIEYNSLHFYSEKLPRLRNVDLPVI